MRMSGWQLDWVDVAKCDSEDAQLASDGCFEEKAEQKRRRVWPGSVNWRCCPRLVADNKPKRERREQGWLCWLYWLYWQAGMRPSGGCAAV